MRMNSIRLGERTEEFMRAGHGTHRPLAAQQSRRLLNSEELMLKKNHLMAGLALVLASTFALAACSSGSSSEATEESSAPSMESSAPSTDTMDPAADLVGAGCADYAAAVPDGDGSVEGMAQDPVVDRPSWRKVHANDASD